MHTFLMVLSVLLLVPGSIFALWLLRHFGGWTWHRDVQVLLLSVPLLSLMIDLFAVDHFVGQACFASAPRWDRLLSLLLPLGMGLIAMAGGGLGMVRQLLLHRVVAHQGHPAGTEMEALVTRLATVLGILPPRVLVYPFRGPLALTYGILHPTVVLSPWMLEHLDTGEREAVLAHELAHIARYDALVGWVAQLLRDTFWYVPTSWAVYQQLQQEKELASDDLALHLMHRPLGLASALAKVWQATVHLPASSTGLALVGMESSIEGRIMRLLYPQTQTNNLLSAWWLSLGSVLLALVGLVMIEAVMIVVILSTMGCGPLAFLGILR
ncbi:MAG: hypothetical protein NVS4B12_15690 [Ktedonobacteraceae bacterium]